MDAARHPVVDRAYVGTGVRLGQQVTRTVDELYAWTICVIVVSCVSGIVQDLGAPVHHRGEYERVLEVVLIRPVSTVVVGDLEVGVAH
jgi:hypothetical protein